MAGSDGYPYAVPLNYVYDEREKRSFFTAPARDTSWMPSAKMRRFFLRHRKGSAGAGGVHHLFFQCDCLCRARVLSDDSQKRRTLRLLADKYVGDPLEKVDAEIDRFYDTVIMVEISVEHMTGKQAIELVR